MLQALVGVMVAEHSSYPLKVGFAQFLCPVCIISPTNKYPCVCYSVIEAGKVKTEW